MKHFTSILLFLPLLLLNKVSVAQEYFSTTTFGDASIDIIYNHATDSNGNIYTPGLYSGTLTVGSETITWAGGNADGFLAMHDNEGTPMGIQTFSGAADNVALDVAVDANDNIYITGYFQGAGPNAFDADPGPDQFLLETPSPFLSRDCFIIKLDSNRQFVWARQVSNPAGAANEDSTAIEVDANGDVYIAGSFVYADFDPDPTVSEELFSADGGTSSDGFLLKLDTDGNFAWVKTYAGPGGSVDVNDIEFDTDGNILVIGSFENEVDLDMDETATDIYTSNGGFDSFISKIDADGNYIWGSTFGGSNLEIARSIRSIDGNVYITGMFSGTVDLDPGAGTTEVTSNGDWDAYYSKFDSDGNFQYTYTLGGEGNLNLEEAYSVQMGADGNLYITGSFIGTTDFDAGAGTVEETSLGATDAFYLVTDTAGNYIDHWTIGGSGRELNTMMFFNDNNEIVAFGGFYSGDIDFNPFNGEDFGSNSGSSDVYFSHYTLEQTMDVNDNNLNGVSIYPNPFTESINISTIDGIETYELYSISGQLIASGKAKQTFNFSNLSQGIYILKLNGSTHSLTKKISKM